MATGLGKFCLPIAVLLCLAGQARAADLYSPQPVSAWRFLDEVRVGVFAHGVDDQPEQGSVDVNLEFLSSKIPFGDPSSWYVPRLHAGTTINTDGDTSHVYAGFTWDFHLLDRVFFEASFGGGVHNGETEAPYPEGTTALGCPVLFRESASLGYHLTESWSVMGTIEHLSNAGLCDENRGITNAGVRLGYRF